MSAPQANLQTLTAAARKEVEDAAAQELLKYKEELEQSQRLIESMSKTWDQKVNYATHSGFVCVLVRFRRKSVGAEIDRVRKQDVEREGERGHACRICVYAWPSNTQSSHFFLNVHVRACMYAFVIVCARARTCLRVCR